MVDVTRAASVYDSLTDEELIAAWANAHEAAVQYRSHQERIEMVLEQRMDERKATSLFHPDYQCFLAEVSPDYDPGKLARLRELLPPEVIAEGYTPPTMATVQIPEHWDMRKVKPWTKYGEEIAQIIEGARIPGRRRLVVKPKKKEATDG